MIFIIAYASVWFIVVTVLSLMNRKFDPKGQKQEMIKDWLHDPKEGVIMSNWGMMIPNGTILQIFRYFKDDGVFINQMLTHMDENKEDSMVSKVFGEERTMQYGEIRELLIDELQIKVDKMIDFNKLKVCSYLRVSAHMSLLQLFFFSFLFLNS